MASGSEDLGNSITQMPLFNKVERPVAFLYPLAHGNRLPPLFKYAIRTNYEQSENSMAVAFHRHLVNHPFETAVPLFKAKSAGAGPLQSSSVWVFPELKRF